MIATSSPPLVNEERVRPFSPEDAPCCQALIAKLNLFKNLAPPHLKRLAECAMRKRFEPGDVIFREGDPANRFYMILSGSVVLVSEDDSGAEVPIQTVGPGNDLGWSWLFPPYYCHFTARAIERTEAIFFYGTRLREQCEDDRDFGYEITRRVAAVVIENVQALRKELIQSWKAGR